MFAALEALYHRDKDSGLLITKTGHNRTGHNKAGNKKRLTIDDSEYGAGSLERRCVLYGSLRMFIDRNLMWIVEGKGAVSRWRSFYLLQFC